MFTTPAFTPIASLDDKRLVILIGIAISVIEELALQLDEDPNYILCEQLFLVTKDVNTAGTSSYLEKLFSHYSLLHRAIS